VLEKAIDIFSSLGVQYECWLSGREREFFAWCIYFYNKGINLASSEAVALLEEKMGFDKKNRGVYIYRSKLKEKEWIYQTKTGLEIPDFFKYTGENKDSEVVNFNFNILIKHNL
jgi:hypothetical protein